MRSPVVRRFFGLGLLFAALSTRGVAQQPLQAVQGVVRDSSGVPLAGAEVVVGPRSAVTTGQGNFRIDSLRPGQYHITIRLVGYSPVRSRIAVVAAEPTRLEYYLVRAPVVLPTMMVKGHRTGIYGSVGDTAFRAAVGARVQLGNGGEVRTDSMGRFAFPGLRDGQYMVRVTFPGYTERRFLVELKHGEGSELAVLLAPYNGHAPADDGALADLGKRLAVGLERERLTATELVRYSALPLCDLPRIRAEIGRERGVPILFSLNGTTAERIEDFSRICAWRADEVELVEFGVDVCKDLTRSIPDMLGIWCSGRTRNVPRSMVGGGRRINSQPGGMRYVIIWEKR
jgi:carboxypeptidase family protein